MTELNCGAAALGSGGWSLAEIASAAGVSRAAASAWRSGKAKPAEAARRALEGSPWNISPKWWDESAPVAVRRGGGAPARPDGRGTSDTTQLQEELLQRIQALRARGAASDSAATSARLIQLEQKAIVELARLTGQSASNEAQLAGSPAWLKLRDLLLAALSEHPDAARAVLKLLDEVLP